MQTKLLLAAALLSLSSIVLANNVATVSANPSQASAISSDASVYFSSLAAQPQFTSVFSVMATGLPASVFDAITNDVGDFFIMLATETAEPAYLSSLPTDVQSYLSSVGAAEASIINKDTGNGAAPVSVAVKAAGALVVAGAVAIALL